MGVECDEDGGVMGVGVMGEGVMGGDASDRGRNGFVLVVCNNEGDP